MGIKNMDYKTAQSLVIQKAKPNKKKELPARTSRTEKQRANLSSNAKENALIDAIDQKNSIQKFLEFQEKVKSGLIDPGQLMSGMAPEMAIELLKLAFDGETEKIRLEAIKDVLDRAGYTKVQKVALAQLDASQPKAQLLAFIEGLSKKSGIIEIEDDKEKRPALYRHKWLGEPNSLERKIYKDWAFIDEIPHEARLERYGLDFGYSNDPSALVAIYKYNDGFILDEIIFQKGLSNKQIADTILGQFFFLVFCGRPVFSRGSRFHELQNMDL